MASSLLWGGNTADRTRALATIARNADAARNIHHAAATVRGFGLSDFFGFKKFTIGGLALGALSYLSERFLPKSIKDPSATVIGGLTSNFNRMYVQPGVTKLADTAADAAINGTFDYLVGQLRENASPEIKSFADFIAKFIEEKTKKPILQVLKEAFRFIVHHVLEGLFGFSTKANPNDWFDNKSEVEEKAPRRELPLGAPPAKRIERFFEEVPERFQGLMDGLRSPRRRISLEGEDVIPVPNSRVAFLRRDGTGSDPTVSISDDRRARDYQPYAARIRASRGLLDLLGDSQDTSGTRFRLRRASEVHPQYVRREEVTDGQPGVPKRGARIIGESRRHSPQTITVDLDTGTFPAVTETVEYRTLGEPTDSGPPRRPGFQPSGPLGALQV